MVEMESLSAPRAVLGFGAAGFDTLGGAARTPQQRLRLRPASEQRFVAATANGGRNLTCVDDVELMCAWDGGNAGEPAAAIPGQFASVRLEVIEHVVLEDDRNTITEDSVWRVGLLRRRATLSHDEFVQHYLIRHVPLVMARDPLFDAYSVSLAIDAAASGWDAVVRQRFASLQTWAEHDRLVMEEKPKIREDLGRFVGDLVSYEGHDISSTQPASMQQKQENR